MRWRMILRRCWNRVRQWWETRPLELVIAFATVTYVVVSFFQWNAMRSANEEADLSFQASQRPYVGIGRKDGTMGNLVELEEGKKVTVVLYFHNGGRLPALNFNVQLFAAKGPTLEQHMTRLAYRGRPAVQMAGGNIIPGDSDRKAIFENWIDNTDFELAKKGKKTIPINGMFEYCDEFGDYFCRRFDGQYVPDPIGELNVVMTSDCQYVYPRITPWLPFNLEYLPPCEEPKERDREQARQRRTMTWFAPTPIQRGHRRVHQPRRARSRQKLRFRCRFELDRASGNSPLRVAQTVRS